MSRRHYTAIVNMLRCNSTLAQVHEVTPGLDAGSLLGAYLRLEQLRRDAEAAWNLAVAEATGRQDAAVVMTLLQVAYPLLPSVIDRMFARAESGLEATPFLSVIDAARRIDDMSRRALSIEHSLDTQCTASAQTSSYRRSCVETGRVLYDPLLGGMWSSPYFLPPRVGTLEPRRVRLLIRDTTALDFDLVEDEWLYTLDDDQISTSESVNLTEIASAPNDQVPPTESGPVNDSGDEPLDPV